MMGVRTRLVGCLVSLLVVVSVRWRHHTWEADRAEHVYELGRWNFERATRKIPKYNLGYVDADGKFHGGGIEWVFNHHYIHLSENDYFVIRESDGTFAKKWWIFGSPQR